MGGKAYAAGVVFLPGIKKSVHGSLREKGLFRRQIPRAMQAAWLGSGKSKNYSQCWPRPQTFAAIW